MTTYAHYTAHARMGLCPFADAILARWTWRKLRKGFPDALAVTLMPNHLHMVAPDRGERGRARLRQILGAAGPACGRLTGESPFKPVELPRPLASPDKLQRSVRYAWLNPCRPWKYRGRSVRLVDDPLKWWWSTLRDVVGAVTDPWIPAERLADALGWRPTADIARRLHAYATADDDVAPEARAFPDPVAASSVPEGSVGDVIEAALHATRAAKEELRRRTPARRVGVGLLYRQGWACPRRLAPHFGVRSNTVSRIAASASSAETEAAARCLAPRLRSPSPAAVMEALDLR